MKMLPPYDIYDANIVVSLCRHHARVRAMPSVLRHYATRRPPRMRSYDAA